MYAGGRAHANKSPSIAVLERVAGGAIDAAIDAEVLQEILHRYRAIGRWQDGRIVFDLARRIVPTVFPVTADALDSARELLDEYPDLMARDALHAAICLQHGARLCTFDRDFDDIRGLARIEPESLVAAR